ncbi:type II secretion system F family protein [Paenactinomyces guangxiensis]|uniref:Type II secretion system F family protein n=1 Tax=Paenactinomyces guangxiensis TaxID=1490290 RepID=A0A7W1WNQ2_9BACL|nr:type II secretion system F family protein [Paenactinomyces guangxiensis]MBA4493268.1 type II secretion system F family protein [Paenactinomyces guangxiensis]MBH8589881.1 type II secretion system F family protein [Paenactinomyces guangxiensis]
MWNSVWNSEKCALFSQQLVHLLRSGIPLTASLELLTEQKMIRKETGTHLLQALKQGSSFSEALHQEKFPDLFVSFIRAAEEHGDYVFGLNQCESYYTSRARMIRELGQACIYPCLVLGLVGIALTFMVTAVLPRFSTLYQTLGIELPGLTKILLNLHEIVNLVVMSTGGGILSVLLFAGVLRACPKEKKVFFTGWLFRLPLLGSVYRYRMTHYLSVQLGSLLKAGVPLLTALELMEKLTPWAGLSVCVRQMKQRLLEGASLHQSLKEQSAHLFLPSLPRMVAIGESSGRLDETLLSLGRGTELIIKNKAEQFTRSLEPILIFAVGLFIAVTVIAMFMPMLQLVRAL